MLIFKKYFKCCGWNSESIKLRIHRSRFDSLLKLVEPIDHLFALLTTVVNYYGSENGCLVFGEEKLFIGLEDVLRTTGLPTYSKTVITSEVEEEQLYALYDRLMGGRQRLIMQKRDFTLKSLREIFHKLE